MAIERIFLGWDGPCLPRAARWLRERFANGAGWDLGDCTIVVLGARAGRRLLEVLAQEAGALVLLPPRIITAGDLPEALYTPARRVADPMRVLLTQVAALRRAGRDDPRILQAVVPAPPAVDHWQGWLDLAQDLASLSRDLAAQGLDFESARQRLANLPDFADEERWDALQALHANYLDLLRQQDWQDPHDARQEAIAQRGCACDRHIVLLATTDLNDVCRAMLRQVDARITALLHAPESEAEHFDDLGCLVVDRWHDRRLDLPADAVHVVDRPRDQAYEAMRVIERTSHAHKITADQVTIGLGDDSASPLIERALELAGLPARSAVGLPTSRSAPALLLSSAARYLASRRLDDFAALLRHPDLESYLTGALRQSAPAVHQWLTLLDRYACDTLQRQFTGSWLGDPAVSSGLKAVHAAVRDILPDDADQERPLPQWCRPITDLLTRVYGQTALHRGQDAQLIEALQTFGGVLRDLARLEPADASTPALTAAQAITFALGLVAQQPIPAPPVEHAVELLGWLEIQLDDAPALIVTGFNEGAIPQSVNADAFLPDRLRGALGLPDNRARYARDLYMLTAILASRPHVALIAGRRGLEDDPLAPSRLMLAGDPDQLAPTLLRFYQHAGNQPAEPAPLLLEPGTQSRFVIYPPPAPPPAAPIATLSVTAFRDYLACPYRFYLKHVLKLKALDDRALEMDGMTFGILAHDVLERFALGELAACEDARQVADFLCGELERRAALRFGKAPPAAVAIQCAQLRQRLVALAQWQAQQAGAGWRILRHERSVSATLEVDGLPFTITGRIDRIDRHPQFGHRVLDYKTADSPQKPEQTHRSAGEWVDLQLPLYRVLAATIGVTGHVELGYIQLPKHLGRVGLELAKWDDAELDGALAQAHQVIRDIRAGRFWPPRAPVYADDFALICMDDCIDRSAALAVGDQRFGLDRGAP